MSAGYNDEEFNDLMDAGVYDHDVDAARGDEQREALNLPSDLKPAFVGLNASIDDLIEKGTRLKRQRDEMLAILRDLVHGADMVIPYFNGAAQGYMKEVKRVAQAGVEVAQS